MAGLHWRSNYGLLSLTLPPQIPHSIVDMDGKSENEIANAEPSHNALPTTNMEDTTMNAYTNQTENKRNNNSNNRKQSRVVRELGVVEALSIKQMVNTRGSKSTQKNSASNGCVPCFGYLKKGR